MSPWFGWAEKWRWIILTSGYFLSVKTFFAWRISVYMGGCISFGVKLVQLNEKRWELYEH